jgi:bifunctional DNA-binding transcriptional regulator/antitoxin component of YhaV-PrlF toxin-antitoxin module
MPILEEVRTVTADGRVVVPWVIQRALGLEHGGPVRFRVVDGAVTLIAVDGRKSASVRPADSAESRRTDVRTVLAAELKTLLETVERDRAIEAATL